MPVHRRRVGVSFTFCLLFIPSRFPRGYLIRLIIREQFSTVGISPHVNQVLDDLRGFMPAFAKEFRELTPNCQWQSRSRIQIHEAKIKQRFGCKPTRSVSSIRKADAEKVRVAFISPATSRRSGSMFS